MGVIAQSIVRPSQKVMAMRNATHNQQSPTGDNTGAQPHIGHVYLVGAGPGDPDLLTVKAARLISTAQIIVHDGLVDDAILALAPEHCHMISVAKKRARHTVPQQGINALLIAEARKGHDVVRLKGGDPFIFGRGGEEVDDCRAAGVPVSVIPGISAANGGAAQALLPLTHREDSSAVTFVAGQCKGLSEQKWAGLAGKGRTLVIYMGVHTAGAIVEKLIDDGVTPDMPVAVLENATRSDARALRTLLTDLPDMIQRNTIKSPALLVIGDVVLRANAQDGLEQIKHTLPAMIKEAMA
jgi:uroporphyrin-III C-methyltransferase